MTMIVSGRSSCVELPAKDPHFPQSGTRSAQSHSRRRGRKTAENRTVQSAAAASAQTR